MPIHILIPYFGSGHAFPDFDDGQGYFESRDHDDEESSRPIHQTAFVDNEDAPVEQKDAKFDEEDSGAVDADYYVRPLCGGRRDRISGDVSFHFFWCRSGDHYQSCFSPERPNLLEI